MPSPVPRSGPRCPVDAWARCSRVTEGGADAVPMRMGGLMGAAKAMSVPVEAGQQTVSADVTVRWAWADSDSGDRRRLRLRRLNSRLNSSADPSV